jgi:hypothetical protein
MCKPTSSREDKPMSRPEGPREAYRAALEKERTAWNRLFELQRADPRYPQVLSDWQAAAAEITVEAQRARVRFPKL